MENTTTVRIDLQRLQLLNDRLCQTLEALNQVRMSAHNINAGVFGHGVPAFGLNTPFMGAPAIGGYNPSIYGSSIYGSSIYGTPVYGSPVFGSPVFYGTPAFNTPAYGTAMWGAPAPVSYSNGIDRARAAQFAQPTMW